MKKEITIEDTLTDIEDLVIAQDKALKTADSLLLLKDCMIDILEEQKRLQSREIKQYKYLFYTLVAFHVISLVISYCYAS